MTEKAQNADLRRKPQIFADSPLLLEIPAFGGRRKPQKTADFFRRKPKIFAQKTAGNRRLGSVTLGPSPLARPYLTLWAQAARRIASFLFFNVLHLNGAAVFMTPSPRSRCASLALALWTTTLSARTH